ncbi:hypothetical protein TNCV_431131 [Trichonephila clavipes]|nr:hypothetical protein TNCV_431131 [Trichonephila clavipes]
MDPKLGLIPDHFAKVATTNEVEVSVPAPRSDVIKTLQNQLIEDWESWWSNSNTGLRVKSFFPKPSFRYQFSFQLRYPILNKPMPICFLFVSLQIKNYSQLSLWFCWGH